MAFSGTRSNNVINLTSLDKTSSLSMTLNGQTYAGNYVTPGSTLALSGSLVLAYAGNANDGIWQKSYGSNRYLADISVTSNGLPLTVLVDVTIPTSTSTALKYDVSTGVIQSSSSTFVGASLVSGNVVTLAFKSSASTSASYKASTTSRPVTTVEQFDTTRVFSFD